MKLNKIAASIAAASMIAGFAMPAQAAGVLAQSILEVSNFRFTDSLGAVLDASQFDALVFSDSSDISASLNGVTITDSQGPVTGFGGIDGIHQCLGSTCGALAANDYTSIFGPTTNRARGDTSLSGAPISGTAFATGALAQTLAEAQLITTGTGSAEDNLGLLATLSFSLTQGQAVGVAFDVNTFLRAMLLPGTLIGSTAQARSSWSISLADSAGNTVFDWTPDGATNTSITGGTEIADGCDMTRTLGAQLPGQVATYSCVGGSNALTSFVLDDREFYTLTIAHESTADANLVPEPATLSLLGLSLFGMGAIARRRKNQKA